MGYREWSLDLGTITTIRYLYRCTVCQPVPKEDEMP